MAFGCNAERFEIPDPPAESSTPRPGSRTSGPNDAPVAAPSPSPAPSHGPATPPPVRTVGTLGGLTDFDFDETTLVLASKSGMSTCAFDACSAPSPLSGGPRAPLGFAVAGGRVYYDDARSANDHDLASVALDGSGARTEATYAPFTAGATFYSFHGGESVYGLLRRTPMVDAGRFEHVFLSPATRVENGARVGRITPNVHTNRGARVQSIPAERPSVIRSEPWSFEVAGATVPKPASEPLAVGTSPSTTRGAVATQTVVIRRGEHLEACPLVDGRCDRWLDLGAVPGTFTLDDDALYVGNESGLFACGLADLASTQTCTFTQLAEEPVSAPLYVTARELVYRRGSDVRAAMLPN